MKRQQQFTDGVRHLTQRLNVFAAVSCNISAALTLYAHYGRAEGMCFSLLSLFASQLRVFII